MAVAVEGCKDAWSEGTDGAVLPAFDSLNRQRRWVDVFKRGSKSFEFSVKANQSWIQLSHTAGTIDHDQRIWVEVDWDKLPAGEHSAVVTVSRSGCRKHTHSTECGVFRYLYTPKYRCLWRPDRSDRHRRRMCEENDCRR